MKSRIRLLVLVVLTGAMAAPGAMAALTGSILLQGSVAAATSITVTGTGNYNALDLAVTATDLAVATVNEANNTTTGYKVTVASTNAGLLKNGTAQSLAYTAKYNGATFTLSTTPQTVTNVTSSTAIVNVNKTLTISYTGQAASAMLAGTYSDTLQFTIAAN